jgi:hypothetical protein
MIIHDKTAVKADISEHEVKNCRLCQRAAMCNSFTCYKKKQGIVDCDNCELRLCKLHWRQYFRKKF